METKKERHDGAVHAAETATRSDAFRETFVFLFDGEEAQTVRRFGDLLLDRMLDRSVYQERNPGFSFTLAEMLAVVADFRFLEVFLRGVSLERGLSELAPTEECLSELAEQFAPEVAGLAQRLEREILKLISDEDGQEEASPGDGE